MIQTIKSMGHRRNQTKRKRKKVEDWKVEYLYLVAGNDWEKDGNNEKGI